MSALILLLALSAAPASTAPAAPQTAEAHAALPEVAPDPSLPKPGDGYLGFRLRALNPALDGKFVGIDDLVGDDRDDPQTKLLVLSFMASYCKPCKKEMPYLQKLYAEFKDRGLRILMVDVDADSGGAPIVTKLVEQSGVTFPVLKDIGGLTSRRYLGSRTPLPSMFLMGPDGTIRDVKRGYDEKAGQALRAEIEKALAAPAPSAKK